jgi:hypothetical protein
MSSRAASVKDLREAIATVRVCLAIEEKKPLRFAPSLRSVRAE